MILIFGRNYKDSPPSWYSFFTISSFLTCILWIFTLANEVVAVLTTLGIMWNIDRRVTRSLFYSHDIGMAAVLPHACAHEFLLNFVRNFISESDEWFFVLTLLNILVTPIFSIIMGLTFLAWANSIGDFVADTSLARIGKARTAVS